MASTDKRSWVKEIGITVAGSVLVLLIQSKLGLGVKSPATSPIPASPAPSPARRHDAFRHYEQVMEYARLRQYGPAVESYTEALRLDPDLAAAHAGRGRAYLHQHHFDLGIQDHTEALRLDPTSAQAFLSRGWAYLQTRRYEQAIHDCTAAIRLDPTLSQAYHIRAQACAHSPALPRAVH